MNVSDGLKALQELKSWAAGESTAPAKPTAAELAEQRLEANKAALEAAKAEVAPLQQKIAGYQIRLNTWRQRYLAARKALVEHPLSANPTSIIDKLTEAKSLGSIPQVIGIIIDVLLFLVALAVFDVCQAEKDGLADAIRESQRPYDLAVKGQLEPLFWTRLGLLTEKAKQARAELTWKLREAHAAETEYEVGRDQRTPAARAEAERLQTARRAQANEQTAPARQKAVAVDAEISALLSDALTYQIDLRSRRAGPPEPGIIGFDASERVNLPAGFRPL
jgi:hypothetical protein